MKAPLPLELETARLRLRTPSPDDAEALFEFFGDPEAVKYIGAGHPWDLAKLRNAIERGLVRQAERGMNMFVVERRADGEVLGDCGLGIWRPTGETEIGWRFARRHWGQGYATEAATEVLRFGLEDLGLRRLIAAIHPDNQASQRIAEKLGMSLEGRDTVDGVPVLYYGLTVGPPGDDQLG